MFNSTLGTVDKKGLASWNIDQWEKCILKCGETGSRKYRCDHKKHRTWWKGLTFKELKSQKEEIETYKSNSWKHNDWEFPQIHERHQGTDSKKQLNLKHQAGKIKNKLKKITPRYIVTKLPKYHKIIKRQRRFVFKGVKLVLTANIQH